MKRARLAAALTVLAVGAFGCGAAGGDGPQRGPGADPGSPAEDPIGVAPGPAEDPIDAPPIDPGDPGDPVIDEVCAQSTVAAQTVALPADIIWAVDQSTSMGEETAHVQAKINHFASLIHATTIDFRVVMIASTTGQNPICVPPPLADGACGDHDRFRLVDTHVDSHDALTKIVDELPSYADFLRPNAVKHFVVVSDDDAITARIGNALAFQNELANVQPKLFDRWIFHAIYAYGAAPVVGCLGPFGAGSLYGFTYADLVSQTQGAQGQICLDDWQPVFDAITTAVVTNSSFSCEYTIPEPDEGALDPQKVNVQFLPGGSPPGHRVYRVSGPGDCAVGTGEGGWFFDDENDPETIHLCPETCDVLSADPAAEVEVTFGCASVFRPPA